MSKMNEYDIKDITSRLKAGDFASISSEEWELWTKTLEDLHVNGDKADAVKDGYIDSKEVWAEMQEALAVARNTPEGKEFAKARMLEAKTTRFGKKYGPLMNAIVTGGDIASSLKQIRESDRSTRELRRPAIPIGSGVDPAIDRALRQSEQSNLNAASSVNASRQVINDQFNQDIKNAEIASGGQQAAFGALGQVAATRRTRGSAALAPIIAQIRQSENQNRNQLLGLKQQGQQFADQQRMYASRIANDQYAQDAYAAGKLGSQGRLNLRNSLSRFANVLPGVAAQASMPGPMFGNNAKTVRSSNYNPKYSEYENQVNGSLIDYMRGYSSPNPQISQAGPNFDAMRASIVNRPIARWPEQDMTTTATQPNYLQQTFPLPPMIQLQSSMPNANAAYSREQDRSFLQTPSPWNKKRFDAVNRFYSDGY